MTAERQPMYHRGLLPLSRGRKRSWQDLDWNNRRLATGDINVVLRDGCFGGRFFRQEPGAMSALSKHLREQADPKNF